MSPLLIMTIALVLNTIGFANYAAVLPAVIGSTGFSETQAGIAGGAFFLSYAIASPIFAALTDSHPPKRLYAIGCCFGIAGGVLFPAVSANFEALLISRVASGLGMAGIYMPGLRLLIESLPANEQARAAGIHVSGLTLGLSSSFAVSGIAQWLLGWQGAFWAAAGAAAIAAALVGLSMRSPIMPKAEGNLVQRIRAVTSTKGVGLVLVAVAGNSWEGMAFRTWWVAFLTFVVTLPGNDPYAGWNLALTTAFTGLLAMPLSSLIAHWANIGRRHVVIGIAAASSVMAGGVLAFNIGAPFLIVFALSVVYVCAIFSDAGSLPPSLLARVSQADRGAALALMSLSANSAAWAGVTVCGVVLDLAGGKSSMFAWQITIAVIAAGSLITSIAMLILDRRARV